MSTFSQQYKLHGGRGTTTDFCFYIINGNILGFLFRFKASFYYCEIEHIFFTHTTYILKLKLEFPFQSLKTCKHGR